MNRTKLQQHKPGTAEYVVLHAAWRRSRGRAPSATVSFELNPRRALRWAEDHAYFSEEGVYLCGTTPANYVCRDCGARGVKLWRDYQTFMDQQSLLCLVCACREQGKVRTPTEDGTSLYTDEVRHWFRTAQTRTGWWQGYDPKVGPPADAIETKSDRERTDQIG